MDRNSHIKFGILPIRPKPRKLLKLPQTNDTTYTISRNTTTAPRKRFRWCHSVVSAVAATTLDVVCLTQLGDLAADRTRVRTAVNIEGIDDFSLPRIRKTGTTGRGVATME